MDALIAKLKEEYKDGKKLVIHNCSMCGYGCGYTWDAVSKGWFYDTGCYCTYMRGGWEPREESVIREFLSMSPEWVKRNLAAFVA